jgi:Tol biopolymer transport system component
MHSIIVLISLLSLSIASSALAQEGKILFSSNRDNSTGFDIFVMDADGSNVVNLTKGKSFNDSPAWSPDGERIVFASTRDGNWDVFTMRPDGSDLVNLSNDPATDSEPRFSPDGTRIAFVSNRGGNRELYVMDTNGANPVNLTNNPADDKHPNWSPDSFELVFVSNRDNGGISGDTGDIFLMDADGNNPVNLGFNGGHPIFAPKGREIAFWSTSVEPGNLGIFSIDDTGGKLRKLANGAAAPVYSPDGQFMVFMQRVPGLNWEVMRAKADGTDIVNLTNDSGVDRVGGWFIPAVGAASAVQAIAWGTIKQQLR